jgi:hypothetical protein
MAQSPDVKAAFLQAATSWSELAVQAERTERGWGKPSKP